jgi:peptidyl-Lys metalloendopeptidase
MKHLKYPGQLKWMSAAWLVLAACQANASMQVEQSSTTTPIEVTLSSPASKTEAESGVIVVSIANHSNAPVLLPRIRTPIEGPEPRKQRGEILSVTNAKGEAARYIGSFISFVQSAPREIKYIRVDPGQTVTDELDLSQDYDLRAGGVYQVRYAQPFGSLGMLREGIPSEAVQSNTLEIWINTNLLGIKDNRARVSPAYALYPGEQPASYPGERQCTPQEFDAIATAKGQSEIKARSIYANSALNLYRLEIDQSAVPENYNATLVADDLYTIWLGSPYNSLPQTTIREDRELLSPPVWNNVDFIPLHLAYAVSKRVPQMTFSCGCPSNFSQASGAVVRTSDTLPYRVSICDIFFSLDAEGRTVTLLHEMSHFGDDLAPRTQDYSAGPADSRQLARNDHATAVFSADNFAYWITANAH